MALVTLAAHTRGSTSGTATSLAIPVTVPAQTRLIVALMVRDPTATISGVSLSGTPCTRQLHAVGHTYISDLWVLDAPSPSATTLTVTSTTAVSMGAAVLFVQGAKSLTGSGNLSWGPGTTATASTETSFAKGHLDATPYNGNAQTFTFFGVCASAFNGQYFAPHTLAGFDPMTEVEADAGVATDDVHLSLTTATIPFLSTFPIITRYDFQWDLTFPDVWATLGFAVAASGTTTNSCVPVVGAEISPKVAATATSHTWSHTSEADHTIYLACYSTSNLSTDAGIVATFGGQALVLQTHRLQPENNFHAFYVFSLVSPTIVGAANLVVTFAGGASHNLHAVAFNIANGPIDGSIVAPEGAGEFSNSTTTALTLRVAGFETNDLCVGFVHKTGTITVTSGTQVWNASGNALAVTAGDGGATPLSFTFGSGGEQVYLTFAIPSGCKAVQGGMYQLWTHRANGPSAGLTRYGLPDAESAGVYSTTQAETGAPLCVSGTLRNLRIDLASAPGLGKAWTFTVVRNNVLTPLTLTISDTATSGVCTGVDLAVYRYAMLGLQTTPTNSPLSAAFSYTLEFESGELATQAYGGNSEQFINDTIGVEVKRSVFWPPSNNWATSSDGFRFQYESRIGADGTITELLGLYQTAGDAAFDLYLYKNGVKQDGNNGTVDTLTVVSNVNGTTGRSMGIRRFVLPILTSDQVYVTCTRTAGVAAALRMETQLRVVSTTNGEFTLDGEYGGTSLATNFFEPTSNAAVGGNGSEATTQIPIGPLTNALQITGVTCQTALAPGAGKSWTFTARKNAASGPSASITGSNTSALATTSPVTFATGDKLGVQIAPSGAPLADNPKFWALRGFIEPPDQPTTTPDPDPGPDEVPPPTTPPPSGAGRVRANAWGFA